MMKKILAVFACICMCLTAAHFTVGSHGKSSDAITLTATTGFEQTGVTQDQLTFYRSGADDMVLTDGKLVSTADGEQKAMVKTDVFASREMEIEFSVTPTGPDGEINHGVYFHAKDVKNASQSIHALNVQVKREPNSAYFTVFLRSYLGSYVRDEQKTLKQFYEGGTIDLKLLVDEEDIYVYLDGSDIPSLTKRRHSTTQSGMQVGFRAYECAGEISNIRISSTAVKPDVPTVKLLMVGNSFSVDALCYVHEIARADGINFIVSALYYGGCTLEQHDDFITNRKNVYTLYKNGVTDEPDVTFYDAIADEDWDVVTFQNPSTVAGLYSSWFPYIPKFLTMMESMLPGVEVGLHMTWVSPYFMEGKENRKLANYDDSTDKAHSMNVDTHRRIIKEHGISFVIPSGMTMYNMHGTPVCDATKMETSFCRDETCHANEKGRYAIACTVYETVTGRSVVGNTYAPYGHTYGSDDGASAPVREYVQGVVDAVFATGEYQTMNWFGTSDEVVSITASTKVTRYREGQYFDYGSLTVKARYRDGRVVNTDLFTIDLRRPLTKNDTAVTVSFQGQTVEVPITVE